MSPTPSPRLPAIPALLLLLLLLLQSLANAQQTTITLYEIARNSGSSSGGSAPRAPQLFTPIGVGADGATTYRNEVYLSGALVRGVTTYTTGGSVVTQTAPDTTSTVVATLIADASHLLFSHIPPLPTPTPPSPAPAPAPAPAPEAFPAQVLNCTLDGHGAGACQLRWWERGGRATETFTSAFTGRAVPLYTLTVGLPAPTGVDSTSTSLESVATSAGGNSTQVADGDGDGAGGPRGNGAVLGMRLGLGLGSGSGLGFVAFGVMFGAAIAL